jgi:hypothetical protein
MEERESKRDTHCFNMLPVGDGAVTQLLPSADLTSTGLPESSRPAAIQDRANAL